MSKNKILIGIIALVVIGVAAWGISGTVTKGLISKNDIALWYAAGTASQNFTRATSAGYDMTLQKLDWMGIDVCQVYGGGVNRTKAEIDLALADVGTTNRRMLWLGPGTWTIGANLDLSSYANITVAIAPGAILSHGAYTIKFGGPILAGGHRILSGTGTITYAMPSDQIVYGAWDDSGSDIFFYTGGTQRGLIDSSGFQETVAATNYQIPSMLTMKGYVQRANFSWEDADEIALQPGVYHHAGTVDQLIYWTSSIAYTLDSTGSNTSNSPLRASDWFYLYLDDSAIVTAATYLANSSFFLAAIEEPVWSEANRGWYGSAATGAATATDRCIGAVLTDASGNTAEFYHVGDVVMFGTAVVERAVADLDTTWTDVDCATSIPKFATRAIGEFELIWVDATATGYWRPNGQTNATGHAIAYVAVSTFKDINIVDIITDTAQIFEVKLSASGGETLGAYISGWYFGNGT